MISQLVVGNGCHVEKARRLSVGLFPGKLPRMDKRLLDILVCPVTKGKLVLRGDELWSRQAALAFPIRHGTPVMLESEARPLSVDDIESLKSNDSAH